MSASCPGLRKMKKEHISPCRSHSCQKAWLLIIWVACFGGGNTKLGEWAANFTCTTLVICRTKRPWIGRFEACLGIGAAIRTSLIFALGLAWIAGLDAQLGDRAAHR